MTCLTRETLETRVHVAVTRAGGSIRAATGDPFLDHMVTTLARYAGLGLELEAKGDLRHHLVEDVGIALGLTLAREVPSACARYGWAMVPMDDALVQAAVDLGGRPYYAGRLPSRLYRHFLRSMAVNLGATVHIQVLRGSDRHHLVEAAVKSLGLALRHALRDGEAVFSTKGPVQMRWEEKE